MLQSKFYKNLREIKKIKNFPESYAYGYIREIMKNFSEHFGYIHHNWEDFRKMMNFEGILRYLLVITKFDRFFLKFWKLTINIRTVHEFKKYKATDV